MYKEQKLIARIGQYKIDIGKIAEEQARLQAELEGLKEPELEFREGDYGTVKVVKGGDKDIVSFVVIDGELKYNTGTWNSVTCSGGSNFYTHLVLGNIFDDLKMLSEPLESFTVDDDVKVRLTPSGRMCIEQDNDEVWVNEKAIVEFSNNLRRLLATLKAKEGKL